MVKHLQLDTRDVSDMLKDVKIEIQEGDEHEEIKQ